MTLVRNVVLLGDVRQQLSTLPNDSIQCVITSPPYWSMRDYGMAGQIGLEPTLAEYICNQVAVFEEVRRVLRPDGTLWLNLGDGYFGSGSGPTGDTSTLKASRNQEQSKADRQSFRRDRRDVGDVQHKRGIMPKNLMGIPWRLALALQEAGWWLRSDIIWSKPNPAPESARDRPTRAHEYLFLMTKRPRYFYDAEAIKEPLSANTLARISQANFANQKGGPKDYGKHEKGGARSRSTRKMLENLAGKTGLNPKAIKAPSGVKQNASMTAAISRGLAPGGRNKRTVWSISPQASSEEHYAAFPQRLVEPCLFAGTSAYGACAECEAPFKRLVDIIDHAGVLGASYHDHKNDRARGQRDVPSQALAPQRITRDWVPSCNHPASVGVVPCVVLDPYLGSGTTAIVAKKYGRDYIGIELNEDYVKMAERRISRQQAGMF
jgi:DNA modification methylase